jgi:solute carrier family 35 protein E3
MRGELAAAAWILSSICSSTVLISLNKYITREFEFDFMVSLTAFHFLVTYLLLEVMCNMGFFPRPEEYPSKNRWLMALFGVGSVVFMNFNLAKNSLGFYQLSKLSGIPAVVAYAWIIAKKKTPTNILISLIILLYGFGLYSVNDVELNAIGAIIALMAVIATAAFQVSAQYDQGQFSLSGPQLQLVIALPQFILCTIASFGTEIMNPKRTILKHPFTLREFLLILTTAFFAVSVNVSCFGIIGKTSALTYQVVGHVKTSLILLAGIVLFPPREAIPRGKLMRTIVGMCIAMVGVILYSLFGLRNQAAQVPVKEPGVFQEKLPEKKEVPLPQGLFGAESGGDETNA